MMDSKQAELLSKMKPLARVKEKFKSRTFLFIFFISMVSFCSFYVGLSDALRDQLSISIDRQMQARERLARADIMIMKVEQTLRENSKRIVEVAEFISKILDDPGIDKFEDGSSINSGAQDQLTNLRELDKSYRDLEDYLVFYREILMMRGFSWNFISMEAHAAETAKSSNGLQGMTIEELKPTLLVLVLGVITVLFLLSWVVFCFAKDPEKIRSADNTIRTILGFYIGISTGLLGLPASA